MKAFQATFLSLLIASIASARSIASSRAQDLIRVNIVSGINVIATECAKPIDPGLGDGSDLRIQICNHSSTEAWDVNLPNISGEFKVANSDACMDATTSTTPGSKVKIKKCNGSPEQQWIYSARGAVVSIKLSQNEDLCLDLDPDTDTDTDIGAELLTGLCNKDSLTQLWQIIGVNNT